MISLFIILVCVAVNSVSMEEFHENKLKDNRINQLNDNNTVMDGADIEQVKCSIHCVLCERNGDCLGCEVGYYGPTCTIKCLVYCGHKGCKQNTGTCNDTSIPTTTAIPITLYTKTPMPPTTPAPHTPGETNHKLEIIIGAAGGSGLVLVGAVIFIICTTRSRQSGYGQV